MPDEDSNQQSVPAQSDTAEIEISLGPVKLREEIREVDFPLARRGYDCRAVEAYVARIAQLVEDLEATRSPQGAIDRALGDLSEQTAGILRQAQDTARQIVTSAQAEVSELLSDADRLATTREAEAEERVRALDRDADRIWEERRRLVVDTRGLAESLLKLADDADERFPAAPAEPAADASSDSQSAAGFDAVDERFNGSGDSLVPLR